LIRRGRFLHFRLISKALGPMGSLTTKKEERVDGKRGSTHLAGKDAGANHE